MEPRGPEDIKLPQCVSHYSFVSAAMQREMSYCIFLPSSYSTSQREYPVLYLLHGLRGSENDWMAKTKIADYAGSLNLVVVMPEADDSWYTNSFAEPRNRYEDYVFGDLIREIESKYRVQKTRDARFIAGLSMGGYGALKAGLKNPQKFAAVGAFSSAFGATGSGYADLKTPREAFGPANSPARLQNDDYLLAAHADPEQLPYIFVSCGTEDRLFGDSQKMEELLHLLGVRYEYHESPGKHDWVFWDHSVEAFLREMSLRFPQLQANAARR